MNAAASSNGSNGSNRNNGSRGARSPRAAKTAAAWPQPDFLVTGPRRPALAGVLATTGVLALTLCVGLGLRDQQLVSLQAARLTSAEQRVAELTPQKSPDHGKDKPATRDGGADAALSAQQLSARLNHPWAPLLANVEAETPPGVRWLMLEHDSDSNELRFEGLAPDAATALQLVDMLAARRGWSDVALVRLQAPDAHADAEAGPLWRFEIRAGIDAQQLTLAAREAESD